VAQRMAEILRDPGRDMDASRGGHLAQLVLQNVVQLLGRAGCGSAERPVNYVTPYFGRVVPVLWSRAQIASITPHC
jgi:hypothetical protein